MSSSASRDQPAPIPSGMTGGHDAAEGVLGADSPGLPARLAAFISGRVGAPVTVSELTRISSVGNAREPWSFSATWAGRTIRCVMLVKAAAGQLETTLAPEFLTIAGLAGSGVPLAPALWMDESGDAIGSPFFVTEWVPGTADTRPLRRSEPAAALRQVALDLAVAAAALHRVDPTPFTHLPQTIPGTAATDQLAYWGDLFERQRMEPHPALVLALRWLAERAPTAKRVSVVHGDLRFGNLLYDEGRLTALLDWEMTHLGDPIEDLGWVYRELWTGRRALPFEEFLAAYVAAGGGPVDPEHLRWYQVFNEVKHSVISLTGTRSFADRATTSLRHADRAATIVPFVARILDLLAEAPHRESGTL
ncbi:MAG: phosphotransferase family protein [Acidimicrobiales bacterium]